MASQDNHNVSKTPRKAAAELGLTDINNPTEVERLNKLEWQTTHPFKYKKDENGYYIRVIEENPGTKKTDIREITDTDEAKQVQALFDSASKTASEAPGVAIKVNKQKTAPDTSVTPEPAGVVVPAARAADPTVIAQQASIIAPTTAPAPASVEALTDKGPVIRSSRVEQRNAEQLARAAATASSPIPNNAQQQVDAAQIVTPVAKVNDPTATTKPQHLYDWDSVDELTAYNDGKYSPEKLMLDQEKWARENNKPFNILNWFGLSKDKDMSKSKTENEAEEKKRVGQERMEKFANFLKHLGNFVGTVGFGAPSQTLEHPKELTVRQQALRDKTEALRSAYNKSYFENYYKQRAEEMNQQKLKLAQRQQDQRDAQQYLNERRFELDEKIKNGTLDLKKLEYELKQKVAEGNLTHQAAQDALGWARNALGWARENRQASGTVTEITKPDKYGKSETVTRVVRPGNSAGNAGGTKKKLPGTNGKKKLPGQQ